MSQKKTSLYDDARGTKLGSDEKHQCLHMCQCSDTPKCHWCYMVAQAFRPRHRYHDQEVRPRHFHQIFCALVQTL